MRDGPMTAVVPDTLPDDFVDFDAVDVTGTHEARASRIQRGLPAQAVASALAARMSLPGNVPWTLHDSSGAFLDDSRPIGDQVGPGARLTVTPKTHLGAGAGSGGPV